MSSTESSPGSSPPSSAELPSAPGQPPGDVYRGPEYRAAVGAGKGPAPDFEPLAHPAPYGPHWLYRFAVWVIRLVVYRLFRTTVEGAENLPPPPYIIAANHQAWHDTAFIIAALPTSPMVYTMARRDTVFNRRWKRWLVSRLGVFPIQPAAGELDERAVATVYQVLERGGNVLIFPEGRYSRGRALRPLKRGIAHFSLQAGVPIVPVAVEGVDRLRLFGRVRISIGRPIRPDPPAWWELNRRLQRVVEQVRVGILKAFGRTDAMRRPGRFRGLFRGLFRRRRAEAETGAGRNR
jgi:1-acyl-sn-glycerol-3-phosphate acyltransferase